MAGKETPRQKMINMMYLIFIAMLALNMSKEVLTAFGTLTEELVETNVEIEERNELFMKGLREKARDQEDKYLNIKLRADSISDISKNLYVYLENLKEGAFKTAQEQGIKRTDYEKLDKTVYFEQLFLSSVKVKPAGQEFLDQMKNYREEFFRISTTSESDSTLVYPKIADEVMKKFSTDNVVDSKGRDRTYLDYHFKGMPLIAAITKITLLQSTIKNIEAQLLSTMLQGKLTIEASLTNFDAIVVPDKASYLPSENFTGKIILGRNDETLKANKVTINGNVLDEESMQAGKTLLDFPVGSIGTNKINGMFEFVEGPKLVEIPVEFQYEVVPPPNSAAISADKMRVVYEGVKNPFTISIPGIDANRVQVRAPGIKRGKEVMNEFGITETFNGPSDYEIDLTGETEVDFGDDATKITISVSGSTADGATVGPFNTVYEVKELPRPIAGFDGGYGEIGISKMDLFDANLTATFENFNFKLPLIVQSFDILIDGTLYPCVGQQLSQAAQQAVLSTSGVISVENIKVRGLGVNIGIKSPSNLLMVVN